MERKHMLEIMNGLFEYVLCQVKFDKGLAMERLRDMGWTDEDLQYFDAEHMFEEDAE